MGEDRPRNMASGSRGGRVARSGRRRGGSRPASKRLLMILFHFPPIGGVSMARNVGNVEHLPRSGWAPLVISPRGGSTLEDPDALSLVAPGTHVVRTRWFAPNSLRPIVSLLRVLSRLPNAARSASSPSRRDHGVVGRPDTSETGRERVGGAPSRYWRVQQLMFFPDSEIGWLPFAVAAALRIHGSNRFEAVYSTSSPITAHLIAGIVKRLTGAPWVAEFRDPWIGNPVARPLPWLHRRLQVRIERWIVHEADRLVFLSPGTMQRYRSRYPRAAEMITITNGHDRTEVEPQSQTRSPSLRSSPYRIVWTGALYRPDELQLFLEALAALVSRRPALNGQLEVHFYGHVSDDCQAVADRFGGTGQLDGMLRFRGFVPRRVALQALADADAALVMLGSRPGMEQFVPGKIFDCIGLSKPLLAVLPAGDARDILVDLEWGIIADPHIDDVGRAVEQLLASPAPTRLADPTGKYDRVTLVARLAETVDEAMADVRRKRGVRATP
jgi:glycosyltransferase involved in cell wall biosynthesis